MKAISNENLIDGLHYGPDCTGFIPKLSYQVTNTAATKSVKVTEASTFEAGATLKKVLVHVHDVDGNQKHDVIEAAAGNVTIDLSGLNLAGISFTATVICDKGCKADLGVYNLTGKSETGDFANSAKQGKRD